jgi:hypothetical protein
MCKVRQLAYELASEGVIEIKSKGTIISPSAPVKGPIRLSIRRIGDDSPLS